MELIKHAVENHFELKSCVEPFLNIFDFMTDQINRLKDEEFIDAEKIYGIGAVHFWNSFFEYLRLPSDRQHFQSWIQKKDLDSDG